MINYRYRAINTMGRTVRGTVTAENESDLELRLKQTGLEVISAKALRERRALITRGVRVRDLIMLCLHMEQLDRAGVPIHQALTDIRDSTDSARLRDVLTSVTESLKGGKILSAALAEHPRIFSQVFIGLIAAGEKTGKLSEAFGHIATHLKWSDDIRRKIKRSTRYPLALLVVISVVVAILMTFVVPKLLDFILMQGFAIPWHTHALIAVSDAFQHSWYIIFGTPIIFSAAIILLYRKSPTFALRFDQLMLRIPYIGSVMRKIDMARFSHFFSIMFNSGIDLLQSLKTARDVVHNRVLKNAVEEARDNITSGTSLTNALRDTQQFPSLVIRMFKVGEDSGNMGDALENITFFYDREVNESVDTMIGMIQPILTIVMGAVIFWVIAAVFGPLYESLGQMKF